jgi:hypothetical protein
MFSKIGLNKEQQMKNKIEVEGKTFYFCGLQKFLKEVPEVGERVQWWESEIGGVFKLSRTAFSLVSRISNPISEFEITTQFKSFTFAPPKDFASLNFRKKKEYDNEILLRNCLADKRLKLPEDKTFLCKINLGRSAYCHPSIQFWSPSMGFYVEDRKRRIVLRFQTFDEAMLNIAEDYESIWNELTKFVPYFIAARHDVLEQMKEKNENRMGT